MMRWRERFAFARRQVMDPGRGLSVFLSRLSIFGLVFAVAILLAVMSVMNGFEREMDDRILSLVPHVTQRGYASDAEWRAQKEQLAQLAGVSKAALFYEREALLVRGLKVEAAKLMGLEAASIADWQRWSPTEPKRLEQNEVLIGSRLAARLQVGVGATLRLLLPEDTLLANQRTRIAAVKVAGLLSTQTELDEGLIIGRLQDIAAFGSEGASANGLALQLDDLFAAPEVRWGLYQSLPAHFYLTDWTGSHGNLYQAIRLSSDLITLLLTTIIAVAAFNVVSSLMLVIIDRRSAIAILQVMGASRKDIAWIYLFQGALIGVLGATVGLTLGGALAVMAPQLLVAIEGAVGIQLLNTDVYPLAFLPVDIRLSDILTLWIVSVFLCISSALIPAYRASKVPVAQALALGSA